MPVHFKLTKDGHTRRAAFAEIPAWTDLAARLHALYNIPVDRVGVSYVDADNDEITVSSDEELRDFYDAAYQPGAAVKLSVWDLGVPRGSPPAAALNPSAGSRNTFGIGQDTFEFVEPGWQRLDGFPLPGFLDSGNTSDGPHAFVEIVNSDASGFGKEDGDGTETESVGQASTAQPRTREEKGKQRSMSFGAASITSLVGEEPSEKFPIHVIDHNSRRRASATGTQFLADDVQVYPPEQIGEHSTPKVDAAEFKEPEAPAVEPVTKQQAESADMQDPPLPSIDPTPSSNATLSHDVATLLTTVTNIISAHPELSEGIRNITNNARSGAYWTAYNTYNATATEISRAEELCRIEAEAARKVTDALGNIFRSFTLGNASADTNRSADGPGEPSNPYEHLRRPLWASRSIPTLNSRRPRSANWPIPAWPFGGEHPFYGPPPPPFHHGPFHGPHPPRGPPHGAMPPPPPPPPPPHHESPLPPPPPPPPAPPAEDGRSPKPDSPRPAPPPPGSHRSHSPGSPHGSHGRHGHGPHFHGHGLRGGPHGGPPSHGEPHGPLGYFVPPPPPPPHGVFGMFPPGPPPPIGPPRPRGPPPFAGTLPPGAFALNATPRAAGVAQLYSGPSAPVYVSPFHAPEETAAKPTEQQLRDQVEESKWAYKVRKEEYRKYRDERKKEKEARKNSDAAEAKASFAAHEEGPSQIVSQGRNGYPQLEMYSVPGPGPRRHHTHLGHGSTSRGVERKTEDLNTRAQTRIAKRLADMGFTEGSYPELPDKIKAQMPGNGAISKEGEDDAVTTLLEEMLARSARSPGGRGGAWH